jgi:hypothetical protein
MRKFVKASIAVGTCLVLTGCPQVKSVQGEVSGPQVIFGWMSSAVVGKQLVAGNTLKVGDHVSVGAGASVTISVQGTDGKDCELTYSADFFVAEPVDCSKQKEENEQKKQEQQQQEQTQQQEPSQGQEGQASQGDSAQNGGGTNGTPGGGSGSGMGGPQVIATAVPSYSNFMPIVQDTLTVIGGLAVAKEVHDQTDGNKDKPLSK